MYLGLKVCIGCRVVQYLHTVCSFEVLFIFFQQASSLYFLFCFLFVFDLHEKSYGPVALVIHGATGKLSGENMLAFCVCVWRHVSDIDISV